MPRRRRPFIRAEAHRDARLIVIAAEDSEATVRYFKAMVSRRYFRSAKLHVEVLTRDTTASAPMHVLKQLDDWRRIYQLDADDELWLVIDVDRWGDAKLSGIASQCWDKGINLAISNPAIEIWFLLHLLDPRDLDTETQAALLDNSKVNKNRTRLEQAILDEVGAYNKRNLNVDHFLPHLEDAIARAEALDVAPDDRWPQQLGTRVYLLARSIITAAR